MKYPFERVVLDFGDTVLRVCRAVLGPSMDADDAWSETFLSALKAWPKLDEDTNVEAWLVTVAHRKAVDITRQHARRARAQPSVAPEDFENLENGASGASPLLADAHLAAMEIWTSVANLPEKQRLAIAYHYLGGLSHVETAKLINSNADAVRRAAADGINTLRKAYGHEY